LDFIATYIPLRTYQEVVLLYIPVSQCEINMSSSTIKILKAEDNLSVYVSGKKNGKININVKLMRRE
jgi:hypothetical protein